MKLFENIYGYHHFNVRNFPSHRTHGGSWFSLPGLHRWTDFWYNTSGHNWLSQCMTSSIRSRRRREGAGVRVIRLHPLVMVVARLGPWPRGSPGHSNGGISGGSVACRMHTGFGHLKITRVCVCVSACVFVRTRMNMPGHSCMCVCPRPCACVNSPTPLHRVPQQDLHPKCLR